MKSKLAPRVIMGIVVAASFVTVAMTALTISWFEGPNVSTEDDDYLNGEIGLREYFYSGDGTQEKPYEIVSPVHLYNLSRLQNLGIFPQKTYFQVGHTFDIEGVPTLKCIASYEEDGTPNYADCLDMGDFCNESDVYTIGGEGVPFVGEINGNGLPIKNLVVYGNPEDIGVFGYVAPGGKLEGLVFDNLEIVSLGYNPSVGALDNLLFSQNIDNIFNSDSDLCNQMSLSLYAYDPLNDEYDSANLKTLNGSSGTYLEHVNAEDYVVTVNDLSYFNGYFKATWPSDTRFTYQLTSSSPVLIKKPSDVNITGATEDDFIIDLNPLIASSSFNSTSHTQVNARLYLSASCVVDGYTFTRVIQSYEIEIQNNGHLYVDGASTANVYCDYIDQNDSTDHNTSYHHGVNVGFVAGHVDGSITSCFVFNGKFTFNDSEHIPMGSETDTALVGEIGQNVSNTIDPELGLVVNGDIGIMNFSKIYSMIRSNAVKSTKVQAGQLAPSYSTTKLNYISYKKFINEDSIDKYIDYLRYFEGQKENYEFITKTSTNMSANTNPHWHEYTITSDANKIPDDFNSVDFLWNKVIEDDDDVDRGLGVFKVVSSYSKAAKDNPESYGIYQVDYIGDCRISTNKTPKTKVYFSTAEYDHTVSGQTSWSDSGPLRATTIPSYSDVRSFGYPFSRDINYVFELDLAQMSNAGGNDYMWNNNSEFLTNYLSSKLIDKYGAPVTPGTARFGFMFRSSENEILDSLSSYMPVGVPGAKNPYENAEGETHYYPSNSIVFRIENPNGANVSVVGNGNDITVYKYNPKSDDELPTDDRGVKALYSMRSCNVGGNDGHRYFTYNVGNGFGDPNAGAVSTSATVNGNNMSDGNCLYGHIFNLPQGDYVLGSRTGTANVYFLAVQGQTEGTIGNTDITTIDNYINDVEFLLEEPTFANYPAGFNKALFTFKGFFNNSLGDLYVDVVTVGEKKYPKVRFDNSVVFVTYLLTYTRHPERTYYINDDVWDTINHTYTP